MNAAVYKAKLLALQNNVKTLMDSAVGSYRFDRVRNVFERYKSIRNALVSSMPHLFGDLSTDEWPRATFNPQDSEDYAGFDNTDYVQVIELELLQNEIQYCLNILESVDVFPLAMTKEGIFFAGQSYDAYTSIRDILSTATKSIDLIDGFISSELLDMLTVKRDGVEVRILTKTVDNKTKVAVQAFNQQYKNLTVQDGSTFHDRFIIIDEQDYYHFGASLKDAGKRSFMFSRIEEPTVIKGLQTEWEKAWRKSSSAA